MDAIPEGFEWSHVLPSGKAVTNLTATRDELLEVLGVQRALEAIGSA